MKIFLFYFLTGGFAMISFLLSGQELKQAEPFLPDIMGQYPNVRDVAISEAGDEVYFTVQSHLQDVNIILCLKQKNGAWLEPEVASFSGRYNDLEPFLGKDGKRLYFASNRPEKSSVTEPKDYDIWYVERNEMHAKWSDPINIGSPVNTSGNEFYPSVAASGNLYYTSDGPVSSGKDDIILSEWRDGKYTEPKPVGDSVNSEGYEFNAQVAPDESWLVFTCYNKEGGFGSGDLYICYRKENGSWSTPENMGKEINSAQMDYCPFYDAERGILYFTSQRSSFHIPYTPPLDHNQLMKQFQAYSNGQSRIYKMDWRRGTRDKGRETSDK